MKRLLSACLMLSVAMAFTACGGDDDNGSEKGKIGQACLDDGTCTEGECVSNLCTDCTAGAKDCVCGENDACDGELTCDNGICKEAAGDCCPGQDLFITVDGAVVDLATQQGVQADVAALAPLTALSGDINSHVAEASAAASGVFHFDCFDVSTVSLGLVLLADDPGFDGAGGSFFPTITGIAGYADNTDKVCEDSATAMVINNQMQAGLDQIPNLDKAGVGYIIGIVMDKSHAPIEGATVVKGDGSALDAVLYPSADFTTFDGAATSANGVYLIPTQLGLTPLMGVKDGYTWANDVFKAATVPGAAYFVPLIANE